MKRLLVLLMCITLVGCMACGEQESSSGGSTEIAVLNSTDSYVFSYNGTEFGVNEDISTVLPKLGECLNYYEATSCAFEGLDKIYTYASFQIDTFPKDGKDVIACIYFKDDLVKTKEGVSLYMSKSDMIKAYGEATESSGTAYIYKKGNGFLRFILDDKDEIISIEYQTEVTYK